MTLSGSLRFADGSKRHWEFTANYDGKDVPVTVTSKGVNAAGQQVSNVTVYNKQ